MGKSQTKARGNTTNNPMWTGKLPVTMLSQDFRSIFPPSILLLCHPSRPTTPVQSGARVWGKLVLWGVKDTCRVLYIICVHKCLLSNRLFLPRGGTTRCLLSCTQIQLNHWPQEKTALPQWDMGSSDSFKELELIGTNFRIHKHQSDHSPWGMLCPRAPRAAL